MASLSGLLVRLATIRLPHEASVALTSDRTRVRVNVRWQRIERANTLHTKCVYVSNTLESCVAPRERGAPHACRLDAPADGVWYGQHYLVEVPIPLVAHVTSGGGAIWCRKPLCPPGSRP